MATVHRAENTDDRVRLEGIVDGLAALDRPVVLPLHPRTRKQMAAFGILPRGSLRILDPVGYLDMLQLQACSACVLTDSGGVQKEAYYLEVPCVTIRDETEWTETVEVGWNTLVAPEAGSIRAGLSRVTADRLPHPELYGAGDTARRIAALLD